MNARQRIAVALLTVSAAGFASWQAYEGWAPVAMIPTKGDVPTIGHGSTRWEDGRPVKMGESITPERAEALARTLMQRDERVLIESLPGVALYPEEFDLYVDFIGQYGSGNWRGSSMRRHLGAGNYVAACYSLLRYRFAAGYDCSTPFNRRCRGVWDRQLDRFARCWRAQ